MYRELPLESVGYTESKHMCISILSVFCLKCADPNILNAIYNSEALNDVFMGNFQKDPTLTWQYFGSSTGFFRIYPGGLMFKYNVQVFMNIHLKNNWAVPNLITP